MKSNLHNNYYCHFLLFTFSFCCDIKRKSEPKKKNTLINSNANALQDPSGALRAVLAYRLKLFCVPKTTARSSSAALTGVRGCPLLTRFFWSRVFSFFC